MTKKKKVRRKQEVIKQEPEVLELVEDEEQYDANPFVFQGLVARFNDSKKVARVTDPRKLELLDALRKRMGMIYQACSVVGISPSTFYKWFKEDLAFAMEVENIKEFVLDFVESNLLKKIKDGDTISSIFYLKTKGKHRGWIEGPQTQVNINMPVNSMVSKDFAKILQAAQEIEDV